MYFVEVCSQVSTLLVTVTVSSLQFHGGMYIYEVYLKHACRVVVAVNESSSHHFTVTCDAADSANVVSTRGELFTQDCIPPKHWYGEGGGSTLPAFNNFSEII